MLYQIALQLFIVVRPQDFRNTHITVTNRLFQPL
ncbi:Uncharacterised protein [Vibrio cholerae]|nr:Uncharacterised protein [Vibrio cholerae]CSI07763.1 Uncharacterised protein [Vibrio cholerae]